MFVRIATRHTVHVRKLHILIRHKVDLKSIRLEVNIINVNIQQICWRWLEFMIMWLSEHRFTKKHCMF